MKCVPVVRTWGYGETYGWSVLGLLVSSCTNHWTPLGTYFLRRRVFVREHPLLVPVNRTKQPRCVGKVRLGGVRKSGSRKGRSGLVVTPYGGKGRDVTPPSFSD